MRRRLRDLLALFLSALPDFHGKGRVTLLLDRCLTNHNDPASYMAAVKLFGARLLLDLRMTGELFVFYYRRYEPEYVGTLRRLYTGGNFIDAGSNVGVYVVCMADLVRKAGGRIFSIEAIPSNSERQRINIALNESADLVDLVCVAVGAKAGTVRMDGDFASANINGVVSPNGTLTVSMTTLDQLAAERGWSEIGAIKIDVEGYEPEVLRGAMTLLRRDRPVIFAEFNRERMSMNGFTMDESWQMLRSLNYRACYLANSVLREIDEPGEHENLFFLPGPVASPRQ